MNENKQTSKNKDNNSIVGELETTMETIANLSKEVQKLAGKLSVLAQQCQEVDKLGVRLQSSTDKSRRLLKQLDFSSGTDRIDMKVDRKAEILEEHPTLEKVIFDQFYGLNHELDGLQLFNDKRHSCYGFRYNRCIHVMDTLKMIFHFLSLCEKYRGYAYGGFVRDVLIPFMILRDSKEVEFKDVDIWFSNTQDCENFLNFVNKLPYLKLTKDEFTPSSVNVKEYPMEQRSQYILSYNGMGPGGMDKVALVDLVVSKQLPVNDFDINLLVYKPRGMDYGQTEMSWFRVEENAEGDSYKYSVNDLVENIKNKRTKLLSGYERFLSTSIGGNEISSMMKRITIDRISRMKQWGWNVKTNENEVPQFKVVRYDHKENHYYNSDYKFVIKQLSTGDTYIVGTDFENDGEIKPLTVEEIKIATSLGLCVFKK